MKYNCELIQDLMPLCMDHMASEESRKAVAEHLAECPECEGFYKRMENAETVQEKFSQPSGTDCYRHTTDTGQTGTEEIDSEPKNADYAEVARRLRRRRLRNCILLILFILVMFQFAVICLNFAAGYRFTPIAAAGLENKLNPESVLLGEYDWGSRRFYFYDCKNYYIITGARSTWHGWTNESYYFVREKKAKPDAVEITGALCYGADDRNTALQLLSVKCHDERIAYMEVSFFGKKEEKEIINDDVVIFAIEVEDKTEQLVNTPAGTAYDADGNALYYLRETEDLNWEWIEAALQ